MAKPSVDILQEKEAILTEAVRKAMAAVKKSATVQNLKNLEAAEKALADFTAVKTATPADRRLKNLREVHAYLSEEKGYKVSERKIYDDKRIITKQADGSILARDAADYAGRFLTKKDGTEDSEGELSRRKLEKEIELQEEKISRERRRNQVESGRLILRSKVDQQLAARAAFLVSDLEAFAHGKLPEIAEQVLDAANTPAEVAPILAELRARIGPEMITTFLGEIRKWMDRYAQPLQFQAPLLSELGLEDDEPEETDE